MKPDIFRLEQAIRSLAQAYPHIAEARDLARSFAAWSEQERPNLPAEGTAWNQAVGSFFDAYVRSAGRAFSSSGSVQPSASRMVHAGIHLALTGGRIDLSAALAHGARGVLAYLSHRKG